MSRKTTLAIVIMSVLVGIGMFRARAFSTSAPFAQLKENYKVVEDNFSFKKAAPKERFIDDDNGLIEDKNNEAIGKVKNFILQQPNLYPIQEHHRLKAESRRSPMGTFVSFKVYQGNIPVIGMQLDFRVNRLGNVTEVFNGYKPVNEVRVELDHKKTVEEVLQIQQHQYGAAAGALLQSTYSSVIWVEPYSMQAHLGYVIPVISKPKKSEVPERAIFSVTTGQLLARELPKSEFDSLK